MLIIPLCHQDGGGGGGGEITFKNLAWANSINEELKDNIVLKQIEKLFEKYLLSEEKKLHFLIIGAPMKEGIDLRLT